VLFRWGRSGVRRTVPSSPAKNRRRPRTVHHALRSLSFDSRLVPPDRLKMMPARRAPFRANGGGLGFWRTDDPERPHAPCAVNEPERAQCRHGEKRLLRTAREHRRSSTSARQERGVDAFALCSRGGEMVLAKPTPVPPLDGPKAHREFSLRTCARWLRFRRPLTRPYLTARKTKPGASFAAIARVAAPSRSLGPLPSYFGTAHRRGRARGRLPRSPAPAPVSNAQLRSGSPEMTLSSRFFFFFFFLLKAADVQSSKSSRAARGSPSSRSDRRRRPRPSHGALRVPEERGSRFRRAQRRVLSTIL